MTDFCPFSPYSPHAGMNGQGNCGVGQEVPAGSSFINQMGTPVVFQVPWGKTNKTILLTPASLTSSWGMDRGCGVVASNFSQDSIHLEFEE